MVTATADWKLKPWLGDGSELGVAVSDPVRPTEPATDDDGSGALNGSARRTAHAPVASSSLAAAHANDAELCGHPKPTYSTVS